MTASVPDQINGVIRAIILALTNADSPCVMSPVPKRIVPMYPGTTISWDAGCEGQLAFQLVSMTPKYRSDGRVTLKTPCSVDWWDVQLRMQIVRCTPTINDAGKAPSPSAIDQSGNTLLSDMQNMLSALTAQKPVYQVGNWQPTGPEGGNVSGEWSFTMRADAQPC